MRQILSCSRSLKAKLYFQKIALSENDTEEFPKYALYAYGEGQYTEKLRNMQFNGIPVLFVPGNSGSYKQGLDRI
jgi:GPI inositol-deacylase